MHLTSSLIAICQLAPIVLAAPNTSARTKEGEASSSTRPTNVHNPRTTPVCAPQSQAIEFLRGFNPNLGEHIYTTDAVEMGNLVKNSGYQFEGTAGRVFPSAAQDTVPFYRLYDPAVLHHFYTINEQERNDTIRLGYVDQGISGYLYATQLCDSIPLYRTYQPLAHDHFYTTNVAERDNAVAGLGYVDEGITAYILPA